MEAICKYHTSKEYRVPITRIRFYSPETRVFSHDATVENVNELVSCMEKQSDMYVYSGGSDQLDGQLHSTEYPLFTNGARRVLRIEHEGKTIWANN